MHSMALQLSRKPGGSPQGQQIWDCAHKVDLPCRILARDELPQKARGYSGALQARKGTGSAGVDEGRAFPKEALGQFSYGAGSVAG